MSVKNPKIVICGNYGQGNLGDEAILSGILRIVKSAFLNAKITIFSSNSAYSKKHFSLKTINFFPAGFRSFIKFWLAGQFFFTLKEILRADLVILGGGGLFSDEKPRAVWIWFIQALWLIILRKKYVCLGQSIGPLSSKMARKLTAMVFKNALLVTVRDNQSQQLLNELGITNIHVLADAAYAIGYDGDSFHNRADYIILSLRSWVNELPSITLALAEMIDWLYEIKKMKTKFLPFQANEDLEKFKVLQNLVKNKEALELVNCVDYNEAIEQIARSKMVIGMRLHSIIFSVLTKTPFLALSYSTKVKDFVKTLGLGNWLEYKKITLDNLKKESTQILDKSNFYNKYLEKQKLHFTYEVFKHEQLLKDLLK